MADSASFTLDPSEAEAAAWKDANRQLRRSNSLQEIGITATGDGMFAVGTERFETLPEAIARARLERDRLDEAECLLAVMGHCLDGLDELGWGLAAIHLSLAIDTARVEEDRVRAPDVFSP
jgi:hypothetical protein